MTIQEIFDDLGIDYLGEGRHHHSRPGWIQIKNCPFCGSQNYHLGFNLQLKFFACWRCGGHYGPKVLEALGLSRKEAHSILPGMIAPGRVENRERSKISIQEPAGIGPFGPSHVRYLRSRGFDPEEVSRIWGVEGIGLSAHLSWRLYIPIIHRAQRVSWTTRAIGDRVVQRYVSASAQQEVLNHKELIYGMDFCHHSIVVVEGPLDAWKVGPGAGALFGTAFTTAQVKKLVEIPRRFICFDSSPEAQVKAKNLASQLSCFPGVTQNLIIDAKDPGCATKKELRLIRKVAGIV